MAVRLARLCLSSGLVAVLLAGCSSGTPEQVVQTNAPSKILTGEAFLSGLGLERPDPAKARPDNRPRAELVIPPDRSLPPPEDVETQTAANWPDDPDVARARRLARMRSESDENAFDRRDRSALSAREMREGPDIPVSRRRPQKFARENEQTTLSITQLRREAALAREIRKRQRLAAGPSRSLMEPPADYQVAPSDAPPPEKKRRWWPFGKR